MKKLIEIREAMDEEFLEWAVVLNYIEFSQKNLQILLGFHKDRFLLEGRLYQIVFYLKMWKLINLSNHLVTKQVRNIYIRTSINLNPRITISNVGISSYNR